MSKKTPAKKTTTKKAPAKKKTSTAKVSAAPAPKKKKTSAKAAAPAAKPAAHASKSGTKSPAPSAGKTKAAATKPVTPLKPVKSKNVLLAGPARFGSSLGMSSASAGGLNIAGGSNENRKKKSQDPVAAAVNKQFGTTGATKAQGSTSGIGARSQMRRDTKKG